MPLRARKGLEDIFAFDYEDDSWRKLKEEYKFMGLLMPCCDALAIPKTSKNGNFFFAHSKKGECSSEAESEEHRYIKMLVARAAKNCGWDVKTEFQGMSELGESWIADVMCTQGAVKVVFEIQLSRQTKQETMDRQKRYELSGVRSAWFASEATFDKEYICQDKSIPFFLISKPRIGEIPKVILFNKALDSFVADMLSKRLRWGEKQVVLSIEYLNDVCWKCGIDNKQIIGYGIEDDWWEDSVKSIPDVSEVLRRLQIYIDNSNLKALGLNTIQEFNSVGGKVRNYPFSNVCINCGVMQNAYHLIEKLNSGTNSRGNVRYISPKHCEGQWILS